MHCFVESQTISFFLYYRQGVGVCKERELLGQRPLGIGLVLRGGERMDQRETCIRCIRITIKM